MTWYWGQYAGGGGTCCGRRHRTLAAARKCRDRAVRIIRRKMPDAYWMPVVRQSDGAKAVEVSDFDPDER